PCGVSLSTSPQEGRVGRGCRVRGAARTNGWQPPVASHNSRTAGWSGLSYVRTPIYAKRLHRKAADEKPLFRAAASRKNDQADLAKLERSTVATRPEIDAAILKRKPPGRAISKFGSYGPHSQARTLARDRNP